MRELLPSATPKLVKLKSLLNPAASDEETGTYEGPKPGSPFSKDGIHGTVSLNGQIAWLYGARGVEVVSPDTGSTNVVWSHRGGSQWSNVSCAVPLRSSHSLILGLNSEEGCGLVCVLDLRRSKVIRAISVPRAVTSIAIVSEGLGGREVAYMGNLLQSFHGVVAVGTVGGMLFLLDLCLDLAGAETDELSPLECNMIGLADTTGFDDDDDEEVPLSMASRRQNLLDGGEVLCICLIELTSPHFYFRKADEAVLECFLADETSVSALEYLPALGQLCVGYSFGGFQLWRLGPIALDFSGRPAPQPQLRAPVVSFSHQEPDNDPRKFNYLWVAYSRSDFSAAALVQLYMLSYQSHTDGDQSGDSSFYQNLISVALRFEERLCPVVSEAVGSRLVSCYTLEYMRRSEDSGERTPDRTLTVLAWVVKYSSSIVDDLDPDADGALKEADTSSHLALFDINRWYQAQMPSRCRMDRSGEGVCSFFSQYSAGRLGPHCLCARVDPSSVSPYSAGTQSGLGTPEQLFYPSALSFSALFLCGEQSVFCKYLGLQRQVLSNLEQQGPAYLLVPSEAYTELRKAFLLGHQPAESLTKEEEREAILTTLLHHGNVEAIVACVKAWSTLEFSSINCDLRFLLQWTWSRVVQLKTDFHQSSERLFNCCGVPVDHTLRQTLTELNSRLSHLLFILHSLQSVSLQIPTTDTGMNDLDMKVGAASLLALYMKVIIWLLRIGLLPETSPDDVSVVSGMLASSSRFSVFYPYERLRDWWVKRRDSLVSMANDQPISQRSSIRRKVAPRAATKPISVPPLLMDIVASACGDGLAQLYATESAANSGSNGHRGNFSVSPHPPPSVHCLASVFLLDSCPLDLKHTVFVYTLLDVASALQRSSSNTVNFPVSGAGPLGVYESSGVAGLEDGGGFGEDGEETGLWTFPSIEEAMAAEFSYSDAFLRMIRGIWALDHGDFTGTMELLGDPVTLRLIPDWLSRSVLEALLGQGEMEVALLYIRLRQRHLPLSTGSDYKAMLGVLLGNGLLSEALRMARQAPSAGLERGELFKFFLGACKEAGQLAYLTTMPLVSGESEILKSFLQENSQDLLLMGLLQRGLVVEALGMERTLVQGPSSHGLLNRPGTTGYIRGGSILPAAVRERSDTRSTILSWYGRVIPQSHRRGTLSSGGALPDSATGTTAVSKPVPLSRRIYSKQGDDLPKGRAFRNARDGHESRFMEDVLGSVHDISSLPNGAEKLLSVVPQAFRDSNMREPSGSVVNFESNKDRRQVMSDTISFLASTPHLSASQKSACYKLGPCALTPQLLEGCEEATSLLATPVIIRRTPAASQVSYDDDLDSTQLRLTGRKHLARKSQSIMKVRSSLASSVSSVTNSVPGTTDECSGSGASVSDRAQEEVNAGNNGRAVNYGGEDSETSSVSTGQSSLASCGVLSSDKPQLTRGGLGSNRARIATPGGFGIGVVSEPSGGRRRVSFGGTDVRHDDGTEEAIPRLASLDEEEVVLEDGAEDSKLSGQSEDSKLSGQSEDYSSSSEPSFLDATETQESDNTSGASLSSLELSVIDAADDVSPIKQSASSEPCMGSRQVDHHSPPAALQSSKLKATSPSPPLRKSPRKKLPSPMLKLSPGKSSAPSTPPKSSSTPPKSSKKASVTAPLESSPSLPTRTSPRRPSPQGSPQSLPQRSPKTSPAQRGSSVSQSPSPPSSFSTPSSRQAVAEESSVAKEVSVSSVGSGRLLWSSVRTRSVSSTVSSVSSVVASSSSNVAAAALDVSGQLDVSATASQTGSSLLKQTPRRHRSSSPEESELAVASVSSRSPSVSSFRSDTSILSQTSSGSVGRISPRRPLRQVPSPLVTSALDDIQAGNTDASSSRTVFSSDTGPTALHGFSPRVLRSAKGKESTESVSVTSNDTSTATGNDVESLASDGVASPLGVSSPVGAAEASPISSDVSPSVESRSKVADVSPSVGSRLKVADVSPSVGSRSKVADVSPSVESRSKVVDVSPSMESRSKVVDGSQSMESGAKSPDSSTAEGKWLRCSGSTPTMGQRSMLSEDGSLVTETVQQITSTFAARGRSPGTVAMQRSPIGAHKTVAMQRSPIAAGARSSGLALRSRIQAERLSGKASSARQVFEFSAPMKPGVPSSTCGQSPSSPGLSHQFTSPMEPGVPSSICGQSPRSQVKPHLFTSPTEPGVPSSICGQSPRSPVKPHLFTSPTEPGVPSSICGQSPRSPVKPHQFTSPVHVNPRGSTTHHGPTDHGPENHESADHGTADPSSSSSLSPSSGSRRPLHGDLEPSVSSAAGPAVSVAGFVLAGQDSPTQQPHDVTVLPSSDKEEAVDSSKNEGVDSAEGKNSSPRGEDSLEKVGRENTTGPQALENTKVTAVSRKTSTSSSPRRTRQSSGESIQSRNLRKDSSNKSMEGSPLPEQRSTSGSPRKTRQTSGSSTTGRTLRSVSSERSSESSPSTTGEATTKTPEKTRKASGGSTTSRGSGKDSSDKTTEQASAVARGSSGKTRQSSSQNVRRSTRVRRTSEESEDRAYSESEISPRRRTRTAYDGTLNIRRKVEAEKFFSESDVSPVRTGRRRASTRTRTPIRTAAVKGGRRTGFFQGLEPVVESPIHSSGPASPSGSVPATVPGELEVIMSCPKSPVTVTPATMPPKPATTLRSRPTRAPKHPIVAQATVGTSRRRTRQASASSDTKSTKAATKGKKSRSPPASQVSSSESNVVFEDEKSAAVTGYVVDVDTSRGDAVGSAGAKDVVAGVADPGGNRMGRKVATRGSTRLSVAPVKTISAGPLLSAAIDEEDNVSETSEPPRKCTRGRGQRNSAVTVNEEKQSKAPATKKAATTRGRKVPSASENLVGGKPPIVSKSPLAGKSPISSARLVATSRVKKARNVAARTKTAAGKAEGDATPAVRRRRGRPAAKRSDDGDAAGSPPAIRRKTTKMEQAEDKKPAASTRKKVPIKPADNEKVAAKRNVGKVETKSPAVAPRRGLRTRTKIAWS